jgi:hypothetical protein|tara:strand:- start:6534 stop:6941 length:408 start_codon:yes stop_codon:yes gene_type:complete
MTNTITYTTSGSAVFTQDFALDLYAGTLGTDTTWLEGGDSAGYPGNLDGFQAKNTNTSNATAGLKLVCGRMTTVAVDNETITLTGAATKVISAISGDTSTAAASLMIKSISATGVLSLTVVGTQVANVPIWLVVA